MEGVKISNGQRALKTQRRQEEKSGVWTPPKLCNKNYKEHKYNKLEDKMGYDYESSNRTLKWMKEDFHNKIVKYLGNK
jgi:hypothetical protein